MNNRRFVSLCILIFFLWICTLYLVPPTRLSPSEKTLPFFDPNEIVTESKQKLQKVDKNSIVFVGDVMLARNVEYLMSKYGYRYPYSGFQSFRNDQYVVGNFEGSIPETHHKTPVSGFSFSIDETYIKGLEEFGFTHVSLANNHSYDFGYTDFLHTQKILHTTDIESFGDQNNQASSTISFIQLDDQTVALIGVYAVFSAPTQQEIATLMQRATEHSSQQIVYVHWGTEYARIHNSFQEKLAKQLIDAGADAIIGHHPHVIQDIQMYKSKPIFYSLGNFIFDQYFSLDVQVGLTLHLSLSEQSLVYELIPVTSIGSRSVPRVMSYYEKEEILKDIAKNSDTELSKMITDGRIMVFK